MNLFTPEDFELFDTAKFYIPLHTRAFAAQRANARLAEIAKGWPVVFTNDHSDIAYWSEGKESGDTRKARLAFIEEIVKEPCKHEPEARFFITGEYSGHSCRNCGVKLIAEWKEKK